MMSTIEPKQRYGRWTVISHAARRETNITKNYQKYWRCRCDCGTERDVRRDGLYNGSSKSCGCLQREIAAKQAAKMGRESALPKGIGSFNYVFRAYTAGAVKRDLPFELSKKQFRDIITQPCHYCGDSPSQVYGEGLYNGDFVFTGIDRANNSEGYTIENSLPCCTACNKMKLAHNKEEFLARIKRVYEYLSFSGDSTA